MSGDAAWSRDHSQELKPGCRSEQTVENLKQAFPQLKDWVKTSCDTPLTHICVCVFVCVQTQHGTPQINPPCSALITFHCSTCYSAAAAFRCSVASVTLLHVEDECTEKENPSQTWNFKGFDDNLGFITSGVEAVQNWKQQLIRFWAHCARPITWLKVWLNKHKGTLQGDNAAAAVQMEQAKRAFPRRCAGLLTKGSSFSLDMISMYGWLKRTFHKSQPSENQLLFLIFSHYWFSPFQTHDSCSTPTPI